MLNSQCNNVEYTYRCERERERELKVLFCVHSVTKNIHVDRSRIHVDR